MAHKPLPLEKCLEVLRKAPFGRLATARDGRPYVVPVSFVYHNEKVYFHSSPNGRKMEEIVANPNVCLQADDEVTLIHRDLACTFTVHYYSAHVFGRARVVENPALRLEALQAIVSKFDREGVAPPLTRSDLEANPLVVVEIEPDEISGVDHARLPARA
ncbi:MAG: pyridoxamine 5'-phosphate oxidase family protein [Chloroflexota bacterium]